MNWPTEDKFKGLIYKGFRWYIVFIVLLAILEAVMRRQVSIPDFLTVPFVIILTIWVVICVILGKLLRDVNRVGSLGEFIFTTWMMIILFVVAWICGYIFLVTVTKNEVIMGNSPAEFTALWTAILSLTISFFKVEVLFQSPD